MPESFLLPELITCACEKSPASAALCYGSLTLDYQTLQRDVQAFAGALTALGLQRGDRVGIYLEKRFETVIASFGATAAGCVFVPLNPLLKAEQVGYILRDCNVRVLVTSPERLALLADTLAQCPDLREVVLTEGKAVVPAAAQPTTLWRDLLDGPQRPVSRVIDTDMAAILYT